MGTEAFFFFWLNLRFIGLRAPSRVTRQRLVTEKEEEKSRSSLRNRNQSRASRPDHRTTSASLKYQASSQEALSLLCSQERSNVETEISLSIQTILKGRPHSSGRWSTQNKFNVFLESFFISQCFFLFYLIDLLLIYFGFDFVFLGDLYVFVSLYVFFSLICFFFGSPSPPPQHPPPFVLSQSVFCFCFFCLPVCFLMRGRKRE